MGLVWLEGFETLGPIGAGDSTFEQALMSKYTYYGTGVTTHWLLAGAESEGVALEMNYNGDGYLSKSFDLDPDWVVGVYWRSMGPTTTLHEDVIEILNGGSLQLRLEVDDQNTINLIQNLTQIATGTTVLADDTWYYIELKCHINSATSGSYEIKIDGVTEVSASGVKTGTYDYANVVKFGPSDGGFDDIYIKTGDPADTFVGPCKVRVAFPTSDGTITDWTTSSGTTHYDLVDEKPPGLTDYTYSDTLNEQERFGLSVPGSDPILGAMLCAVTRLDLPGVVELQALVDSNSTLSTYDQAIGTEEWFTTTHLVELNPDTTTAWTPTTINAAEWGVKVL